MADVLTDLTPEALSGANQANMARWFALVCEWSRGEVADGLEIVRALTGFPLAPFNGVMRTRLPAESTPDEIDARIQATIAYFQSRSQPFIWTIWPGTSPATLAARLLAHGFHPAGHEPAMAVDLAMLPDAVSTPPDLTIEHVHGQPKVDEHFKTLCRGFGFPDNMAAAVLGWASEIEAHAFGGEPDCAYTLYTAYLDGRPVATAELLLAAGVAGIYGVATLPEARRRGIGAAVTLAPLLRARALGYHAGILQASTKGFPVYERLGFRQTCAFAEFIWAPTH